MINYREEEKRILDEILGKGVYDNRIRPSGTNGTGQIEIKLISELLTEIKSQDVQFS